MVIWAALGAVFVAFQTWVYARWIIDGGLRSVPADSYRVSLATKATVWIFQAGIIIALVAVVAILVRQCRRARTITFDTAVFVGWLAAGWMNPILNYSHVSYLLNPYQLHVISWGPYIPGWHNPAVLVESALATGLPGMGVMIVGSWTAKLIIAGIARYLPMWAAAAAAVPFVTIFAVGSILVWTLTGLATFPGATGGPTLFAGHYYQVSLVDALAVSCFVYVPQAVAMYTVEQHNTEAAPLRGSDRLPGRLRPWARLLAGVGLVSLGYLAYIIVLSLSLTGAPPPDTPDYFYYYLQQ